MCMASSGGAGRDVPAEKAAAAVNDLIEVREGAARLKILLQEQSSEWTELIDDMLGKLSSALSALDTGGAAAGASSADGVIRPTAAGESSGGRTRRRISYRRSQRSSGKRVTDTLVDGHVWRKYGQKEIQNSPHPRSYYRCTHKTDQGCNAKRQVQACEADPSKYAVTYYGEHTCSDYPSSTAPMIIVAAAADEDDDNLANNLVSFAQTLSPHQLAKEEGVVAASRMSSSWCTTSADDVFSSSADPFVQLAADELAAVVVGSAGRTSDAGLHGGGGGTAAGTDSFATSSPSSLGFRVGSLGTIGDDDFFLFDP